jgi:hypothetical protein
MLWTYGSGDIRVTAPIAAPVTTKLVHVHFAGNNHVLDIPVDKLRHSRQVYENLWGKSRTVTSLIRVDYGYVQEREAEELLAVLVKLEEVIRKRKALEAAAPADRAFLAKKQAIASVQDCNRHDNKAKGRRKCGKCGSTGHNRATCPTNLSAEASIPLVQPGDAASTHA